jgi:hypothetical protein
MGSPVQVRRYPRSCKLNRVHEVLKKFQRQRTLAENNIHCGPGHGKDSARASQKTCQCCISITLLSGEKQQVFGPLRFGCTSFLLQLESS